MTPSLTSFLQYDTDNLLKSIANINMTLSIDQLQKLSIQ